jgi:hypothetical protein
MELKELNEIVRLSLLQLMEETLHSNQGMYTEEGTSLIETLQEIDSARASQQYPGIEETIAGHANHARYYLRNFLELLQGNGTGDFDVPESWRVRAVKEEEWSLLRGELETTYTELMRYIVQVPDWGAENHLAGLIAMIAHSAYHLGAIRQLKQL